MHFHPLPLGIWISLVLIGLVFWPDDSLLPRIVLVFLLVLPQYWASLAWIYLTYLLAVARVFIRYRLRVVCLRCACFVHVQWLRISLPWHALLNPTGCLRRMEHLQRIYGIHDEEEVR